MILHSHHIIPLHTCKDKSCNGYDTKNKHTCDLNNSTNIIELTIEDHAIAHKVLFHLYNRIEDKLAWLGLSNQIPTAEINRLLTIERNKKRKGEKRSEEFKEQCRKRMSGKGNHMHGRSIKFTEERKRKTSERNKSLGITPPSCKGKVMINNGVKNRYIKRGEEIPDGYKLGKLSMKFKWVTNGKINHYIKSEKNITTGWELGRTYIDKGNPL